METLFTTTPELLIAAFAAGLVDSVIGGGGLIQLPALMTVYPAQPPAWWLGTNKLASIFGTGSAAIRYSLTIPVRLSWLVPAALLAFVGAFSGSVLITLTNTAVIKLLVPVLLTAVLVYTLTQKNLGATHAPIDRQRWSALIGFAGCACVGFYDGFFGPGSGSLFMMWMIRFYGYDYLNAACSARILNTFTNAASLLWFGSHGDVSWALGAALAACNIVGALTGTRLAFYGGVRFMRWAFILIVSALIIKTSLQSARGLGWIS